MSADQDGADGVRTKAKYHHGDLKEALLQAAYALVAQDGAENFSLAEACRLAGVSTAAPYKHFRDRDQILEMVVMRGFDVLADRSMAAVQQAGEGTMAGIVAMGAAYIRFAVEEQRLFRLMFGQHPALKRAEPVVNDGKRCFTQVIEQVALYCRLNGCEGDARMIAIRLWTFVHGAAALLIDGDYAVIAPDLDVDAMVRDAAPLLLPRASSGPNADRDAAADCR